MILQRRQIPEEIISEYDLNHLFVNNKIMVEVTGGMYGLPQAGLLAQQQLIKHLATYGYVACTSNPCLFRHESRPIAFTLLVDDFGIKFVDEINAKHLIDCLKNMYSLKVDWSGHSYLGLTIDHNISNNSISISLPQYIDKLLYKFGVVKSTRPVNNPMRYIAPNYGQKLRWQLQMILPY